MCAEQPRAWDRYLPPLLFAYRETPKSSLGFSPFELLYGRTIRGPLNILRDVWDRERNDQVKTTYQYVFEFRQKLEETCRLAREHLSKSQQRYKYFYNRKSRDRVFYEGEQVLLLLPTSHNKVLLLWKGPYRILEKKGVMDYCIDVDGQRKVFHRGLQAQQTADQSHNIIFRFRE